MGSLEFYDRNPNIGLGLAIAITWRPSSVCIQIQLL